MSDDIPDFSRTTQDAEALKTVLDDLERRSRSFGSALTQALSAATVGGKGLDDVLKSTALRLTDIALSAGLKPLDALLGQAVTGLSGVFGGGGSAPVMPFAAGGVVSAPSYFPMGGATGLVGEGGPEAILPLRRGADGSLGVAGGSGAAVNVVFNVTAADAQSFRKSEGQIAAMLTRTVGRGRRGL